MPVSNLRERTLFGWVVDADGAPVVNGKVVIKTDKPVAFAPGGAVVNRPLTAITDGATGHWSVTVFPTNDSITSVQLEITFPTENGTPQQPSATDDKTKTVFSLAYDGGPIEIYQAIAEGVLPTVPPATLLSIIEGIIAQNPGSGGNSLDVFVEKTADYSLAAGDAIKTFINPDATVDIEYDLPLGGLTAGAFKPKVINFSNDRRISIRIQPGQQAILTGSLTGAKTANETLVSGAERGEKAIIGYAGEMVDFSGGVTPKPTFVIDLSGIWE